MHDRLRPILLCLLALACSSEPEPEVTGSGEPWPAGEELFTRGDPRWLGGDGAYSVALGGDRVLWLFGDTFVATSPAHLRSESEMVRNTVAIQEGMDPATASFAPAWRQDPDGSPASFFPEDGERWHWPAHGVRIPDGPLVVFLAIVRNTPGDGLGFAADGWRAVIVDDPDAPPAAWTPRVLEPPAQGFDAIVGTSLVVDGEHVLALAAADGGDHATYLARFPTAALAAGDLSALEWWDGDTWVGAAALSGAPAAIIEEGNTESSLHHDAELGLWLHVSSAGFGATTIAVRTARDPRGPWSARAELYTPPESLTDDPFVYAGKAHPWAQGGGLVVSYVANSRDFDELVARPDELYWPRLATLELAPR